MPVSGIAVSDEVKNIWNRIWKKDAKTKKLPYAIFKFSTDLKNIVVDFDEKYYVKHLSYDDLLATLPTDSPRFFGYDLPMLNVDKTAVTTVVLISWVPAGCPMKWKFLVGTTFLSLQASLRATSYFEGGEIADLNEAELCSKIKGASPIPADQKTSLSEEPVAINEDAA